jgi:hypothetical protein
MIFAFNEDQQDLYHEALLDRPFDITISKLRAYVERPYSRRAAAVDGCTIWMSSDGACFSAHALELPWDRLFAIISDFGPSNGYKLQKIAVEALHENLAIVVRIHFGRDGLGF